MDGALKFVLFYIFFYFIQYQSNTTFFLFHIFWVLPPTPMAYGICTLHSMYKSYLLHHTIILYLTIYFYIH